MQECRETTKRLQKNAKQLGYKEMQNDYKDVQMYCKEIQKNWDTKNLETPKRHKKMQN